jgi:hypothetical protein
MWNFKICTPNQHFVESQIKENGMGLACDMYLKKKYVQNFCSWTPPKKIPLEVPKHRWEDAIKTELKEVGWRGVDGISLTEFTDKWRALNNMTLKLDFP